jgi:hypothetical protein
MLRLFVFGHVGGTDMFLNGAADRGGASTRNGAFYETQGSKQDVLALYMLWKKLDDDQSGRVDIQEFRIYAEQHMQELEVFNDQQRGIGLSRPTVMDKGFISQLCEKLVGLLLGKKSSFAIEDMMKIIWPLSTSSDWKVMKDWCKDFQSQAVKTRVQTPPVLPDAELEGLTSVFYHFDGDGSGHVCTEELLMSGLIYEEQIDAFLSDYDLDGQDGLDLLEFCEMLCPAGYRAHPKAKHAVLTNGTKVVYDASMAQWREEEVDDFDAA